MFAHHALRPRLVAMEVLTTLLAVEELLDELHSVVAATLLPGCDVAPALRKVRLLRNRCQLLTGRVALHRQQQRTRHLRMNSDQGAAVYLSGGWLRLTTTEVSPPSQGVVSPLPSGKPYSPSRGDNSWRTEGEASPGSKRTICCQCQFVSGPVEHHSDHLTARACTS